jgi:hypothetical protein
MAKRPKTPVIDPTRNVLDLVKAGREADQRFETGMRNGMEKLMLFRHKSTHRLKQLENRLQDQMRAAESQRLDQLAALRDRYEARIADMLSSATETNSPLVSAQLVQIQSTFNERLRELEQFRYESSGKSSGLSAGWAIFITVTTVLVSIAGVAFIVITRH